MTNKEIRAVLEPSLYEHVAAKSKAAGMTKAKWIAHLIQQDMASPKLTDSDRIDETNLHFEEGQVIDGQQNKTYKMLWASFEASQKSSKFVYHLSNKLGVICKVAGVSRSNKKKLEVIATFPGDPVRINEDGTFLKVYPHGAVEYYTKSEIAAMAEATAAEAAIEIQTPAEEVIIATAPINAPVDEQLEAAPTETVAPAAAQQLSLPLDMEKEPMKQAEARVRLGFGSSVEDALAFSQVCIQAATEAGYSHTDGTIWKKTGNGKKAQWTEVPSVALATA